MRFASIFLALLLLTGQAWAGPDYVAGIPGLVTPLSSTVLVGAAVLAANNTATPPCNFAARATRRAW